jgi:hypothetical protein
MSKRKRSNEEELDFLDEENELDSNNSNHLDKVMTLLEDSGIEFSVKKVANGKSLFLDNEIVFRFNHDNELTAIDK